MLWCDMTWCDLMWYNMIYADIYIYICVCRIVPNNWSAGIPSASQQSPGLSTPSIRRSSSACGWPWVYIINIYIYMCVFWHVEVSLYAFIQYVYTNEKCSCWYWSHYGFVFIHLVSWVFSHLQYWFIQAIDVCKRCLKNCL